MFSRVYSCCLQDGKLVRSLICHNEVKFAWYKIVSPLWLQLCKNLWMCVKRIGRKLGKNNSGLLFNVVYSLSFFSFFFLKDFCSCSKVCVVKNNSEKEILDSNAILNFEQSIGGKGRWNRVWFWAASEVSLAKTSKRGVERQTPVRIRNVHLGAWNTFSSLWGPMFLPSWEI